MKTKIKVLAIAALISISSCMSHQERHSIETRLESLRSELATQQAYLEASSDELAQIKTPKFLRTTAERTEQIRHQSEKIHKIENRISRLNNDIYELNEKLK